MTNRFLCSAILLLFYTAIAAQEGASFHVQQYGTEEGLPSNGIKGLQWDQKNGFLWIATEAGIVRYDGMSFKTFTTEDNPHISNERSLFLVRNNAGTIFTADSPGNIFSVEKNIIRYYGHANITGNRLSNIVVLNVSERFYKAGHLLDNGPFTIQFGMTLPIDDTSCFIAQYGQVFYFTLSMKRPLEIPSLRSLYTYSFMIADHVFMSDSKNNCWLLDKDFKRLQKVPLVFDKQPAEIEKGFYLWENGMSAPLFFHKNKAWKLSFTENTITSVLISDQIPEEPLIRYAQYDENSETLYLGTDSKGIIIIKKNRVMPVRKKRTAPGERTSYYSQVELPDGNILTNDGNVLGSANSKAPNGLAGRFGTNTLLQGDSVFWFIKVNTGASTNPLHKYNFKAQQLKVFPAITERYNQMVLAFSGDSLYAATENGIYKMQGDSLQLLYRYDSSETGKTHFDMKETRPRVLALATCNALLEFDTRTHHLTTLFTSKNYCFRTIWYHKGYIFSGTYGDGFYITKKGKTKKMPLDKNRYLLFTHCFMNDGKGYCWISTNRGLFKASIDDLINAYEKEIEQVYYHYYGRNDGMDMTEMNGGCMPCALAKKDSIISFPTMEGLLWVDPARAVPMLPSGEIFVDEIRVDNRKMSLEEFESEKLGAHNHDIIVSLAFSAWCNKENVYIQYKLNNAREWTDVNTDNGAFIQLSNLSQGNYTLRIRKLNGFGIDNYSYREFSFSIPTPWYERTWFYLLALLLAGSIIVMYFRYRTGILKRRQYKLEQQVAQKTKELQEKNTVLEKNDTIKTRLISIISHDIVTPLKFVTVAGKNLQEKKQIMSEELQDETIREMTNTSQELQLLSTNILNWIKYQNENRRMVRETFNLFEMTSQVFGILQSLAKQKNLQLINSINPDLMIYQYYEPLKILVYNLLTNAIQFTEKGVITVAALKAAKEITVSVTDEGIGMTAEQIQRLMAEEVVITSANVDNKRGHGLGFLIIKDLVKTMNATLHIESKKDRGTTVFVKMPIIDNGVA